MAETIKFKTLNHTGGYATSSDNENIIDFQDYNNSETLVKVNKETQDKIERFRERHFFKKMGHEAIISVFNSENVAA